MTITMPRAVLFGIATMSLFAWALPAQAALPPEWQRLAELTAVLEAAAQVLDGRPIDSVEWMGEDTYRVRAEDCTLELGLRFIPTPGISGPAKFEVEPGEVMC